MRLLGSTSSEQLASSVNARLLGSSRSCRLTPPPGRPLTGFRCPQCAFGSAPCRNLARVVVGLGAVGVMAAAVSAMAALLAATASALLRVSWCACCASMLAGSCMRCDPALDHALRRAGMAQFGLGLPMFLVWTSPSRQRQQWMDWRSSPTWRSSPNWVLAWRACRMSFRGTRKTFARVRRHLCLVLQAMHGQTPCWPQRFSRIFCRVVAPQAHALGGCHPRAPIDQPRNFSERCNT